MTDPKPYGDPVEEPTSVDDVVGRAHEGLADAEAAGRDAVAEGYPAEPAPAEPAPADASPAGDAAPAVTSDPLSPDYEPSEADYAAAGYDPAEPVSAARDLPESAPTASTGYTTPASTVYEDAVTTEYDAPATTAYDAPVASAYEAPVLTPSEPLGGSNPQPIFVQAPEAPRPRGNRGAAGAIGLIAAVAFGVLYLAAWLGFGAINGDVTVDNVADVALGALGTWALWVPTVTFFLAFWLLGGIVNRGRWGLWVIFGLLVGAASYGGHLLGQLFQAPFWELTAREGAALVESQLLVPLAAVAFVLGRELTIWFGAWVAARGRRVTELNNEAQREYERTLEAGPQLYRQ